MSDKVELPAADLQNMHRDLYDYFHVHGPKETADSEESMTYWREWLERYIEPVARSMCNVCRRQCVESEMCSNVRDGGLICDSCIDKTKAEEEAGD